MSSLFCTTQIDLLRHGECEGGPVFRGHMDAPLLPSGLRKMHQQCQKLDEKWQLIISSPLSRCRAFADQFSKQQSIPLYIDERLKEMHFGDWEGQLIQDVWDKDASSLQAWIQDPGIHTPPNGEALIEVQKRVQNALDDIYLQHKGKSLLLVSHGGIIRVILSKILCMPDKALNRLDVPYASISRFATYHSNNNNTYSNNDAIYSNNDTTRSNNDTTKLLAHNIYNA